MNAKWTLALAGMTLLAAANDGFAQGRDDNRRKRGQNQPTTLPSSGKATQPSSRPNDNKRPRTSDPRTVKRSQPPTNPPGKSGSSPRRRTGDGNPKAGGNSNRNRGPIRTGNGSNQPPKRTDKSPRDPRKKPGTGSPSTDPRRKTGSKAGEPRRKTGSTTDGTRRKTGTGTGDPRRKTGNGSKTDPPRRKKSTGSLPGIGDGRRKKSATGPQNGKSTTGKRRKGTGGSLPGLGSRGKTGTRRKTSSGIITSGQRQRFSRNTSAQVRSQLMRQRSRDLARQLQISRAGSTSQTLGLRRTRDWQQWNRDYYSRYRWARGRWGGGWVSRWDSYWERRWRRRYPAVLVVGSTLWGMNRMGYQFGYQDYYNPYAGDPVAIGGGAMIDYSQPICQPIAGGDPGQGDPGQGGQQEQEPVMFVQARQAFQQGNYPLALSDINAALKSAAQDAMMHEFRALVLFAMGEYRQAAAPLNAVLAVGPGFDWPTLRGLYPDAATYTGQYRKLEKFVTDNPKDAAGHFVLGYHYVTLGHSAYALKEFQQAADLAPKDAVAKQMVAMLAKGDSKDDPNEADQEKPIDDTAGGQTIRLEQFTGAWTATRDNGTFKLVMTQDDHFTWTHVDKAGKKTEIKGAYAIKDGSLALEPVTGGVMLATVAFKSDKEMSFRMVSDDDKDPGMTFKKS